MVAPKREKMACQRSMTQKKERKKKKREKRGNHVSKKKRDRDDWREKSHYLKEEAISIHPSIHSYTCTF